MYLLNNFETPSTDPFFHFGIESHISFQVLGNNGVGDLISSRPE